MRALARFVFKILDPFWLGCAMLVAIPIYFIAHMMIEAEKGKVLMNDPRFAEPALLGKSPEQVRSAVGEPQYQGDTEEVGSMKKERVTFFVYWRGSAKCYVRFREGKVESVERSGPRS